MSHLLQMSASKGQARVVSDRSHGMAQDILPLLSTLGPVDERTWSPLSASLLSANTEVQPPRAFQALAA